jgi:hypothetical protein
MFHRNSCQQQPHTDPAGFHFPAVVPAPRVVCSAPVLCSVALKYVRCRAELLAARAEVSATNHKSQPDVIGGHLTSATPLLLVRWLHGSELMLQTNTPATSAPASDRPCSRVKSRCIIGGGSSTTHTSARSASISLKC